MKLKQSYLNEIKNIPVKHTNSGNYQKDQEYLNSEKTFSQYLDVDYEQYFGHHKMTTCPSKASFC